MKYYVTGVFLMWLIHGCTNHNRIIAAIHHIPNNEDSITHLFRHELMLQGWIQKMIQSQSISMPQVVSQVLLFIKQLDNIKSSKILFIVRKKMF